MRFKLILLSIIILAASLRFYSLGTIPPGLNLDEGSQAYDAYSFLLTGKDQWGKAFPVYLRSLGTFQSSLNVYLTIIPVYFFGPTIFSARFISALFGVLTVMFTFLIVNELNYPQKKGLVMISGLLVAISPWAVFFSRQAMEANIALGIFLASLILFILSLKKPQFLILASLLLGIDTYAYPGQRIISVLFLILFLFIFKNAFSNRKIVLIALTIFFLIQIPHILLIHTLAATRRLDQVNYWDHLNGNFIENCLYIIREFFSQFATYLSPKNLFFDPDPQQVRSIPDLSVFYSWMILPFFFGIKEFFKIIKDPVTKLLILTGLISLIPASLTREPFYTMRTLNYLWVVTIVISLGIYFIYQKLNLVIRCLFILSILLLSSVLLYSKYFVLLKYERGQNYAYPYIEVAKITEQLKDKKFVIDTYQGTTYPMIAYYKKYSPWEFQKINSIKNVNNYYNNIDYSYNQIVGNVEIRPIFWKSDICKEQILIGNNIAISSGQIAEHKLKLFHEFKDLTGEIILRAYETDPKGKGCDTKKH